MVDLRPRSKTKSVVPRAVPNKKPILPTTPTTSEDSNLDEETLRKLPRAELQKLAKAHKVKANIKSNLIIQQLLSLQLHGKTRPAEEDAENEPLRKRFKGEAASQGMLISSRPENKARLPNLQPTADVPAQASQNPKSPEAGPSTSRLTPPAQKDEDLWSKTESEMTEEEQLDFATPVSSRLSTPLPANALDLDRCVTIMRQISSQDVTLLDETTKVRDAAMKLRKKARDVRDLVKAERGRRERIKAYFQYWQEIEPRWDRKWLYGEKMVADYKIKLDDLDGPAGPPTLPVIRQFPQEPTNLKGKQRERQVTPIPSRRPILSPEELKRRREAIVSRQEAEQRQLENLWRSEAFFRSKPSEGHESLPHDLGESSNFPDTPLSDESQQAVEDIITSTVPHTTPP